MWDWYWRTWRVKFWQMHTVYFLVILIISLVLARGPLLVRLIVGLIFGAVVIGLMVAYPQFLFRREVKALRLDGEGIERAMGGERLRRPWQELRSVVDHGSYIALTMIEGNAFIVPTKAFADPGQREEFIAFAVHHLPGGRKAG